MNAGGRTVSFLERGLLRSLKNEASRYKDTSTPAPNFGIAATTVEPAGKACLKLHADEAIGPRQWKMTH